MIYIEFFDNRNLALVTNAIEIRLPYRHLIIYNESLNDEVRIFYNERLKAVVPVNSSLKLKDIVSSVDKRGDNTITVDSSGGAFDFYIINYGENLNRKDY